MINIAVFRTGPHRQLDQELVRVPVQREGLNWLTCELAVEPVSSIFYFMNFLIIYSIELDEPIGLGTSGLTKSTTNLVLKTLINIHYT